MVQVSFDKETWLTKSRCPLSFGPSCSIHQPSNEFWSENVVPRMISFINELFSNQNATIIGFTSRTSNTFERQFCKLCFTRTTGYLNPSWAPNLRVVCDLENQTDLDKYISKPEVVYPPGVVFHMLAHVYFAFTKYFFFEKLLSSCCIAQKEISFDIAI